MVVAGDSGEFGDQRLRENFELQRERIQGVTIITFDELFLRLARLISRLLKNPL
jgi:hypothetical protein